MNNTNIRIANRSDAISLIEEFTSEEAQKEAIRDYCCRLERLLEAIKAFLEPMKGDDLSFGDYVEIKQKRYGKKNEMYTYKVIDSFKSNHWVDVPVQTPAKEKIRKYLEPVVSCICCGVNEIEVLNYRIKDVRKVKGEMNDRNLQSDRNR